MEPTPDKLSAVIACYRDAPAVPYMHQRLTSVFRKLDVDNEHVKRPFLQAHHRLRLSCRLRRHFDPSRL